ncbi:hypothetical protein SAMN06298216_1852 [Spirosomataceae bacterium TFI 002]|nr:hypothetical protein SAMN06298216_1852 [Spirosomataceae bacterium TFI 002]
MQNHLEDLKEIRQLMERSSKFLSLSGLSGIAVGVIAIFAAVFVYMRQLLVFGSSYSRYFNWADRYFLILAALVTMALAIVAGIFFTKKKAKKNKEKIWNKLSQKLVLAMSLPLLAGGFTCLALLVHGIIWPLAGLTLVFYGMALINGSQYTYQDVYYLGICEVILGIIALFWVGYSLLFWAVGFGVLHIVYGARMYVKYDK